MELEQVIAEWRSDERRAA